MKIIRLSLVVLSLVIFSSASASKRVLGSQGLEGVTLNHPDLVGESTRGTIVLPKFNYGQKWNITCDYAIEETNPSASPSAAEPCAINIILNLPTDIYRPYSATLRVTGFTGKGIVNSNGKIEVLNYTQLIPNPAASIHHGEILIDNYDSTANFVVSNCRATLLTY